MSEKEPARLDGETRQRAMRFAADRVCAWSLCGRKACLHARACRGDVGRCAHSLSTWFAAIEAERRARPSFAAIEAELTTLAEMKAYRAWREALARAEKESKEDAKETEFLREDLKRRIAALAREARSGEAM
jgi:hypothetical protein